ncbi:hypothetical protein GEV33_009093 [Tenebrio molitor]|uniref:Uncharacterized protein n=1 Tax=Tenebrio molitor TaxID=7067 RepID=A0A8J6LBT1_TENMO|nr:hypothetical protein GEV33_009093 [Tenebrio molitor]
MMNESEMNERETFTQWKVFGGRLPAKAHLDSDFARATVDQDRRRPTTHDWDPPTTRHPQENPPCDPLKLHSRFLCEFAKRQLQTGRSCRRVAGNSSRPCEQDTRGRRHDDSTVTDMDVYHDIGYRLPSTIPYRSQRPIRQEQDRGNTQIKMHVDQFRLEHETPEYVRLRSLPAKPIVDRPLPLLISRQKATFRQRRSKLARH